MGKTDPDPYEGYRANLSGSGDDDSNDKAIRNAIKEAKAKDLLILWVILPFKSAAIYARVKF